MSFDRAQLIRLLEDLQQHGCNYLSISNAYWLSLLQHLQPKVQQEKMEKMIPNLNEMTENIYVNPADSLSIKSFSSKQEHWEDLKNRVLQNPDLLKHVHPGKQLVFGVGNLDAKIFFCGEAPGADEESQGIPFVGRAGQLLMKIIGAMGLSREDVYIGNIMNWRPEMETMVGNRPPTQEEMQFCLPYLIEQVQIVQPQVIVALGATAVNGLLGYDRTRKMSTIRGTWQEFYGTPLMVTFHPSYLLRNQSSAVKRLVWEDMLRVMERVGMPISEKQQQYFLKPTS